MSKVRTLPSAVRNFGLIIVSPRAISIVHVVDDAVHLRDGVALGLEFLAGQLERHLARRVEFAGDKLELHQQARRAAGVVVAVLAGPRPHDVRHEEADLGRREEFAGALARAFRELPQQVFVGAAEEIRLHVGKAEAVAGIGEGLDDARAASPG